ncbi:hypothetical protein B296_00018627 [Ensete ventricosum]|uniref:Uncharacterized protein n=1 Tax=Ensete ventricosum TaxID=4639 RepID=A0A426YUN7_ENSVE|nr:hypothetical protein B296_00018627 [Ensete ventricosum]
MLLLSTVQTLKRSAGCGLQESGCPCPPVERQQCQLPQMAAASEAGVFPGEEQAGNSVQGMVKQVFV